MIALLQRVTSAWVEVKGERTAEISRGLMILLGVERGDSSAQADRLLQRFMAYRVFEDEQGRMNHNIISARGSLLLVPQFTLAADTRSGNRPGFSSAAEPGEGRKWFDYVADRARQQPISVATGMFGADMQVGLVNDGPVTFWLQVAPPRNVSGAGH